MGIMIFMLKSQRRAFRWPNNLRARLYIYIYMMHMSEFVFCQTQNPVSHISAN